MATQELYAFLRQQEGLRLAPYLCPAGYPTIGYGHRIPSLSCPPITPGTAEALLEADVAHAEELALLLCPALGGEPRRLAALTDLVYNVGDGPLHNSTLVHALNDRDWTGAAASFRQWDHAHVRGVLTELPGLKARRAVGATWIEQGG